MFVACCREHSLARSRPSCKHVNSHVIFPKMYQDWKDYDNHDTVTKRLNDNHVEQTCALVMDGPDVKRFVREIFANEKVHRLLRVGAQLPHVKKLRSRFKSKSVAAPIWQVFENDRVNSQKR